ncbi:MAG: hypothetical protein AAGA48_07375 [Myxococcota bacterium]
MFWFLVAAALAERPIVRIDATVLPGLRAIEGTLVVDGDVALVDPLSRLPDPPNDLHALRTFPGTPSRGEVTWVVTEPGTVRFRADLPRRFGALGATHHGLFANGGWYPQPLVDGTLVEATFEVRLALPDDAFAVVGADWGQGHVTTSLTAERVPLAVLPSARRTSLSDDVMLVTRRRPRRGMHKRLVKMLPHVPGPLRGVIVEAPLRRRLTRPGPGLLFLSDRAFRVTTGLGFAHQPAVARGLMAALSGGSDPFVRDLIAAGRVTAYQQADPSLDSENLLGTFRWVPQVNALLSTQNTAFFSDILNRPHPGDPLRDDLVEMWNPTIPGAVVAAQLDDRFGAGTGACVAFAWPDGERRCGLPEGTVASFRRPYPQQDYTIDVDVHGVTVTRESEEKAPPETLGVRIDGEDVVRDFDPGATRIPWPTPPQSVVLDPKRHTAQWSRRGDRWPARYDITAQAWISSINLSQGQVFAWAASTIRRRYDTHNLVSAILSNSRTDLVSLDVSYLRKEGPLLDGFRRPHRISLRVGAGWLNPNFAETDGVQVAIDSTLTWAHDTRVSGDFPLRGHRVSTWVSVGRVLGRSESWVSTSASAMAITSAHPRQAFAAEVIAGLARSNVPQRLLRLGGPRLMQSIPTLPACPSDPSPEDREPCTVLATERAVTHLEHRVALLRNVSLPLWLAWGSELQITTGLEGLVARVDGEGVWATGVTAGIFGLADVLGAEPLGAGVTLAWPLVWDPRLEEIERSAVPQVIVRFTQAF